MVVMCNILIHHYFGISETVAWKTIEEDFLPLKTQVEAILLKHD
jgi:uncharacterized protein with HEPN domain